MPCMLLCVDEQDNTHLTACKAPLSFPPWRLAPDAIETHHLVRLQLTRPHEFSLNECRQRCIYSGAVTAQHSAQHFAQHFRREKVTIRLLPSKFNGLQTPYFRSGEHRPLQFTFSYFLISSLKHWKGAISGHTPKHGGTPLNIDSLRIVGQMLDRGVRISRRCWTSSLSRAPVGV